MCRCSLCFPFTHHEAEFAVCFGKEDRLLRVCHFCQEDLALLGFRANQTVRLEVSKPESRVPLALVVLGPIYSLLEAKA